MPVVSPGAIVRGADSDDHIVPIQSTIGELLRMSQDAGRPGQSLEERMFSLYRFCSFATGLCAPYLELIPDLPSQSAAYRRWQLNRGRLARIDEILDSIRTPRLATPRPQPRETPFGTRYILALDARMSMGEIAAEDTQTTFLDKLFERKDKEALIETVLQLEQAYKFTVRMLASLQILDRTTEVAYRISEFTTTNAKAAKRAMALPGYATGSGSIGAAGTPALTYKDVVKAVRESDDESNAESERYASLYGEIYREIGDG